ncbi:cupin domain-containing protein [Piscinibacter sakaiensis]|uniref:cupin domain-containing protein n=1 Tax=Piscinibacter sakaiensis TaxID=1547922 RepID=UPI003AADCF79
MSAKPAIEPSAFEHELRERGFTEIQQREIAPGVRNDAHSHPFEVRALMLDGELQLSCEGKTETWRAGDIFTMDAGREHVEQFGASGARYLTGRKYPG